MKMARSKGMSAGFTLMELVIIMVILAILAASAVPKYLNLQTEAESAAKDGMAGIVRSGFAIAIAENHGNPTVTQLAGAVQGEGVAATATGVIVLIGNTEHVVRTYTDTSCSTATTAVGDTVACVGSIA